MFKPFKRHYKPCKRKEWDQGYTRCTCPVWLRGTVDGKQLTLPASRFLPEPDCRSVERGRDLAILWERTGKLIRPEEFQPITETTPPPEPNLPTVATAVAEYLTDARLNGNADATLDKKGTILNRQLLPYCKEKGIRFVKELDTNVIRDFRSTWKDEALSRSKKQSRVLGFIWFCERNGWLPPHSASAITKGLGKIQVKATQTGYFPTDEYARIIDATYIYSDRPSVDKHDSSTLGGHRIRALTELMRWTGLRIRDAATLERHRLVIDEATGMWSVMVYQRKTGDPVYCPVPPHVAELLNTVPASQKGNANERYFLWTGQGLPKTVVANWQRSYRKLFKLAKLKEPGEDKAKRCHPHMFRDTFAIESLLSGMRIEEVQTILGHSSIKVTEKSYMPWVRARQSSLNQSVMASWERQGIIKSEGKVVEFRKKKVG
jgi:integrase